MPATWVTDGNLCRKNVLFNRWLLPSLVLDLFGTHYEMKIFCRNVHKATKPKEFQTDWYTICGSDIWSPDLQSAFRFWVRAHACLHACMHAFSQEGFEAVMISSCDRGLTACTHTHTFTHRYACTHVCTNSSKHKLCAGRQARPWWRCIEGTLGSLGKYTNLYPNTPDCHISSCGWRERERGQSVRPLERLTQVRQTAWTKQTSALFSLPSGAFCTLSETTAPVLNCKCADQSKIGWKILK